MSGPALGRPRQLGAALLAAGLAVLAAGAAPHAREEAPARFRPEPLPANPLLRSRGIQFVQADRQGRVFLLHGDTLKLFRIAPGKPAALGALKSERDGGGASDAAMSPAGDLWVLASHPNEVRLFRNAEEKGVAKPSFVVTGVAAPAGEPVLAVAPANVGGGANALEREPREAPPFLMHLAGSAWKTLAEGEAPPRDAHPLRPSELFARFGVALTAGERGSLWVGQRNAYRVRQFSATGSLLNELVVGGGSIRWVERTEADWKRLEAAAREGGVPFDRSRLSPLYAERVVRGLATGRDGRLYLAVEVSGGLALDRFDPRQGSLERVLLANVRTGPGPVTLAAGRTALLLAGRTGEEGIWSLDWERLAQARWTAVPKAVLNGEPLPAGP